MISAKCGGVGLSYSAIFFQKGAQKCDERKSERWIFTEASILQTRVITGMCGAA